MVVSGAVRDGSLYNVPSEDSEAGYFADFMGANRPDNGAEYLEVITSKLAVTFIGVTSAHAASFVIQK